jgi:HlyD family secretion protein
LFGVIVSAGYAYASHEAGIWPWIDRRPLKERYHLATVSHSDLIPILNAPGRLESSRRTIVRCELENIAGTSGGGSSTMLTVVPEGSDVKAGEVIATLDVSTYEEMYRQQLITVEQAKATHLQAKLNHQIALLAVREYRDGTVQETLKGMEGAIALASSDVSRAREHLAWTERMKEKGYASPATIVSEKHSTTQLQMSLDRQNAALDLFKRFTQPKTEKSLQGNVKAAETTLNNESLKLQRQLERLALLKKQVDRCTIRAPFDGLLFYYKDGRNPPAIEEGMSVRQGQALFYLPDLKDMEVALALNESVVNRVRVGQSAKVRMEALPDVVLDGHVASVSQIPVQQNERGEDIRYFIGVVKLDEVAPDAKPGMTARVDIAMSRLNHVLAVPHQAVTTDRGKKICYVIHENSESLERREIEVGHDTSDMIEVTKGLAEGELVALDVHMGDGHVEPLVNFDVGHGRDIKFEKPSAEPPPRDFAQSSRPRRQRDPNAPRRSRGNSSQGQSDSP